MNDNENKRDKGFGQGITLIVIGVIFTLVTVFDFEIDWHVLSKLWPLLLIIIGVCIMPINKWIRAAIAFALLVFGVMAYQQKVEGTTKVKNKTEFRIKSHQRVFFDDDDDSDDD